MNKLPLLISIPHGGTKIPEEVASRFCLSPKDLFEDSDSFTRDIFGIQDNILALVETEIARAFVDLSREISDRPPENPDGIIKSRTCHGHSIYTSDSFPDETTFELLVRKYYTPYHKKIREILKNPTGIKLALDCHSMEPIGPAISPDKGKVRPLICLGNNLGKSCKNEWTEGLAESFRESFQLKEDEVKINDPFAGGFITRKYGNNPLPWIQVEINRKLYLSKPWFDKSNQTVDPARLEQLKTAFKKGLEKFLHHSKF